MKDSPKIIKIDNVEYVPVGSVKAEKLDGMEYAVVRTYSAGVFAGYIKSREGMEVHMVRVRKLWYWDGAATLAQLAMEGVSKPQNCKFPCEVDSTILTQAIEIIPCTSKAQESIAAVPVWRE